MGTEYTARAEPLPGPHRKKARDEWAEKIGPERTG